MNTNCLEGFECYNCGQIDSLKISVSVWATLTDEGSETDGNHYWDDESGAYCPDCTAAGKVKDFFKKEEKTG